jgi:transposase
VKKQVGNKWLYSIQLTCEGYPAQTHRYSLGKGKVCTDVGISDVAIASKNGCFLLKHFVDDVPEYKKYLKARRRLEREIDRQRRSNNPEKFNENGTIKKGVKGKFKVSERQKKNYIKLKELYRIEAERRKLFYEERVNFIRSLGDHLLLEDLCYKAWQRNKRYSRAVGRNAPGLFITMLINKFISTGGKVTKLNTYKTCLSQICPKCGDKKKKDLSEDVHSCKVCGYKMQRDLTSALCGLAVDENQLFHADVAQKLCRELEPLMQTAWKSN